MLRASCALSNLSQLIRCDRNLHMSLIACMLADEPDTSYARSTVALTTVHAAGHTDCGRFTGQSGRLHARQVS